MLTLLVLFSGSLALLAKWEKRGCPVSKGDFLFCIPLDGILPCALLFSEFKNAQSKIVP